MSKQGNKAKSPRPYDPPPKTERKVSNKGSPKFYVGELSSMRLRNLTSGWPDSSSQSERSQREGFKSCNRDGYRGQGESFHPALAISLITASRKESCCKSQKTSVVYHLDPHYHPVLDHHVSFLDCRLPSTEINLITRLEIRLVPARTARSFRSTFQTAPNALLPR